MGGIFRNQPVILTCITLILTSLILGTKSEFFTALKPVPNKDVVRDRNDLVSVKFVWKTRRGGHLWVDMDKYRDDIVTLTDDDFTTRHDKHIQLSFYFNFFGRLVKDLRITKHRGLRSVGYFNKWFITPLLLEPSEMKYCKVKYIDTGHLFLVRWEIEPIDEWDDSKLIIEVSMFCDGRVGFNYKKIPFGFLEILSHEFDGIKNSLGISYAFQLPDGILWLDYVMDIMEYNDLREGLLILFKPLSSCLFYSSCRECTTIVKPLKCSWCQSIKACSSKKDMLKDVWQSNNCDSEEVSDDDQCPLYSEPLINIESPPEVKVEVPVIEPLKEEEESEFLLHMPVSILAIASLLIFGVLCYIKRCTRFFVRLCSRRNPLRPGQRFVWRFDYVAQNPRE